MHWRIRNMLMGMNWWTYVQKHAAGEPNSLIAKRLDISASSIGRWVNGGVSPVQAAAFARAYGRPVLEAFVAAGFLTKDEANARIVIQESIGLEEFDYAVLLAEMDRRLAEAQALKEAEMLRREKLEIANSPFREIWEGVRPSERLTKDDFELTADDGGGYDHQDEDEGLQTDP